MAVETTAYVLVLHTVDHSLRYDTHYWFTKEAVLQLTKYDHKNADEAAHSGASHADETGPSATKRPAIHQIRPDNVRRDLHCSSDKRVEVDISMKSSDIERQSIVDHAAREPGHETKHYVNLPYLALEVGKRIAAMAPCPSLLLSLPLIPLSLPSSLCIHFLSRKSPPPNPARKSPWVAL